MQIHAALHEKGLWREFDELCNEMIITKIGRNLFPILEFAFKGLDEHLNYRIGIKMEPTSFQKLKYSAGRWESLDVQEEVSPSNEIFMAKSGRELLQRGLKLEKLKLTNSKDALQKSDQMIRVQSMHQYVPVLNIYEILATDVFVQVAKFQFPETKFIAVTAYQSDRVKNLKVQKNKFAQGFREGVKLTSGVKRPTSTTPSNSSPDSTLSTSSDPEGPSSKKGRSQEMHFTTGNHESRESRQENLTPYQIPIPNFQNFTHFQQYPHFEHSNVANHASYWNPQLPYGFNTVGQHSTPHFQFGYPWDPT